MAEERDAFLGHEVLPSLEARAIVRREEKAGIALGGGDGADFPQQRHIMRTDIAGTNFGLRGAVYDVRPAQVQANGTPAISSPQAASDIPADGCPGPQAADHRSPRPPELRQG